MPFSKSATTVMHCVPAKDHESIEELVVYCSLGMLYEVEQWIAKGRPIQCEPLSDRKLRKRFTPMEIVSRKGFYSLAELLLINGYDPNGDYRESLSSAVETRNHSMVELLLRYGADPRAVDFTEVLETYDRALMDSFMAAGIDPCANNAVARALWHKARPLLGFVKQYRAQFPGLQRQIDIGLNNFVDREDEKGVSLMLWLRADPYAMVPASAESDNDKYLECPVEKAMRRENDSILLKLLKTPIPTDRVQSLFRSASYWPHPAVVRRLLSVGADPNGRNEEGAHVLDGYVRSLGCSWNDSWRATRDKRGLEALRLLAEAGAKWDIDNDGIAQIRRSLLAGTSSTVKAMLDIFRTANVLSSEQLHELTRTAKMKRLLAGDSPKKPDPTTYYNPRSSFMVSSQMDSSPARSGYWKRHWSKR